MTAAHCFLENSDPSNIVVVVGDHDLDAGNETSYSRTLTVKKITPHEKYNPDTNENDIAVLEIDGEIRYSKGVGPACLPFKFR